MGRFFRGNQEPEAPTEAPREAYEDYGDPDYGDDLYDDGLDDLSGEDETEEDELLAPEEKKNRIRLAFGAGNLFSVILGTVVILVLLTLLLSMINFIMTDLSRNLSLFQNRL